MPILHAALPEEVVIELTEEPTGLRPFLMYYIEEPIFEADLPEVKATRVTSIYSSAANDVLDYNYDD